MRFVTALTLTSWVVGTVGCPHPAAEPKDAGAPIAKVEPLKVEAPKPVPAIGFEAEMSGVVHESLRAQKYVVVMTPDPCDPKKLETTHAAAIAHPDPSAKKKDFYIEPFVKDGQVLYLCAAALDGSGKKIVGFGAYSKNPITFHQPPDGEDDVEIEDLELSLRRLTPPVLMGSDRF